MNRWFSFSVLLLFPFLLKTQSFSSGRTNTPLSIAFKPYGSIVVQSTFILFGRVKLNVGEDVKEGERSATTRLRPVLMAFNKELGVEWEYVFQHVGYRSEIVDVKPYQDSLFLCMILVKKDQDLAKRINVYCINQKGQFKGLIHQANNNSNGKAEDPVFYFESESILSGGMSVTQNGSILVAYAARQNDMQTNFKDKIKLVCHTVVNGAVQKSNSILWADSHNGCDINDILETKGGFVLATNRGKVASYDCSLTYLDKELNLVKTNDYFSHYGSDCNSLLQVNDSLIFVGCNTYNRSFASGLGLLVLNKDLEVQVENEWGNCIHDDVVGMYHQGETVVVGHQNGSTLWAGTKLESVVHKSGVTIFDQLGRIKSNQIFYNGINEHTCGFSKMGTGYILVSSIDEYMERNVGGRLMGNSYIGFILRFFDEKLNLMREQEFGNF